MIEDFAKKVHWLGHDGFRIDAGKIIYFDPYQIAGGPEADLILISHEHFDHCSPADVVKIQGSHTVIVTERDSAKKLNGELRIMKPGESLSVSDVKIEAVASYNIDKNFHPKANNWLGFIVEVEGVKVYHAGDSDFIPEMKDLEVDIAPRVAIPMHYGAIVGDEKDALRFKKTLEGKVKVVVLQKE